MASQVVNVISQNVDCNYLNLLVLEPISPSSSDTISPPPSFIQHPENLYNIFSPFVPDNHLNIVSDQKQRTETEKNNPTDLGIMRISCPEIPGFELVLPIPECTENSPIPENESDEKTKRLRTSFNSKQIRTLEQEFQQNQFIDRLKRVQLADSLQLTEKTIKVWFQNRRMKARRSMQKSRNNSSTKARYPKRLDDTAPNSLPAHLFDLVQAKQADPLPVASEMANRSGHTLGNTNNSSCYYDCPPPDVNRANTFFSQSHLPMNMEEPISWENIFPLMQTKPKSCNSEPMDDLNNLLNELFN